MRIVLTPPTFDPLGVVVLRTTGATTLGEMRRRMNRVATLDLGAVFNDFGCTDADRTLALAWVPVSAAQEAAVARLVQLYALLQVATPQGFFMAAPEVYTPGATESKLTLLVARRLA